MALRRISHKHSSVRPARSSAAAVGGVATLLFLAVVIASCGSGDSATTSSTGGPGNDGSTTSTTAAGEGIAHPTGANEIVLRVATGGGFVPVEFNFTNLPEFSLYGDGRVIVTGPQILIYPGPALPNLQTTVIPEEAIQAILAAAKEAGLFETFDYGQPGITDVGTTTFTVNAEGTTYQADVYALGMEPGSAGLTMEQQQARAALSEFRGKLTDLTAFAGPDLTWESYGFTSLAVYSLPVDTTASTDPTDVQPNRLDWPLADLATLGEEVPPGGYKRFVITGDDLAKVQPLLGEATQITLWQSQGREYHLWFRPLLPDETA